MTGPVRAVKRPIEVHAYEYDGTNADDIVQWADSFRTADDGDPKVWVGVGGELVVYTLEGLHTAEPGDRVMRGVIGEFYPIRPDVYAASYDTLGPV